MVMETECHSNPPVHFHVRTSSGQTFALFFPSGDRRCLLLFSIAASLKGRARGGGFSRISIARVFERTDLMQPHEVRGAGNRFCTGDDADYVAGGGVAVFEQQ